MVMTLDQVQKPRGTKKDGHIKDVFFFWEECTLLIVLNEYH